MPAMGVAMYQEPKWLDYRQAARRVHRDMRTIQRWRRGGMPMRVVDGHREVREDVLLAWWRDRMKADPVHQHRLAALRHQDAAVG